MKNRINTGINIIKQDSVLFVLIILSAVGYLLLFFITKWFLNIITPLPSFLSYIFLINTILALNVVIKNKFASHILLSFNLLIEIISLIYIIKTSTLR